MDRTWLGQVDPYSANEEDRMRLVMDKSRYDTPKGPRFVLACRLEASAEEVESLRTFVPDFGFGSAGDVWDLLHHGVTYEARDVKDVVDRADAMKRRARKLSRRLQAAMQFEGREAVEV
jgi:hypothetical protein